MASAKYKRQRPERLRGAGFGMVYKSKVDSGIAEGPAGLLRTCSVT